MREKCDCCGSEVPLFDIIFTGRKYLCPKCQSVKDPAMMGLSLNIGPSRH
jgi:hypothetical protein